jgi:1-acyl-sn-glycerol-3-phosphate acyltransferase
MRRRKPRHIGPVLRFCVLVVIPLTSALFKWDRRNFDRIPARGPVIMVVNHISYADPFIVARATWDAARVPRFLGKASLFEIPFIGWVLRSVGQIPVNRGTRDAVHSLEDAVAALARGEVVVIYPEGTVTRDADFWPMAGKTGAARLALLAPHVPVVPVGQWGAQNAVDVYRHKYRLLPRKAVTVSVGERVDLAQFADARPTAETLREMMETIMGAITEQVALIRADSNR